MQNAGITYFAYIPLQNKLSSGYNNNKRHDRIAVAMRVTSVTKHSLCGHSLQYEAQFRVTGYKCCHFDAKCGSVMQQLTLTT